MIKHLTNFPEEFFPPVSKDYVQKCLLGAQRASQMSVVVTGVVRDAEPALSRNLACVDHIRGYFKSSSFFAYTNDNSDNSEKILETYCKERYSSVFTSETKGTRKLADKSLERKINMAYARNKYLDYLRDKTVDVIIVLDLDIIGGYSYTGLLNSLSYLDENTCIGSNSLYYKDNQRLFFDTWAYKDKTNKTEEEKNLMCFHRGELPFEVDSCFGGLMIYPSSILKHNIKYTSEDCDHITLHKQLQNLNYNILLNPSQIVLYSEHYYV